MMALREIIRSGTPENILLRTAFLARRRRAWFARFAITPMATAERHQRNR